MKIYINKLDSAITQGSGENSFQVEAKAEYPILGVISVTKTYSDLDMANSFGLISTYSDLRKRFIYTLYLSILFDTEGKVRPDFTFARSYVDMDLFLKFYEIHKNNPVKNKFDPYPSVKGNFDFIYEDSKVNFTVTMGLVKSDNPNGRRTGRTTRKVNEVVETLFTEGSVALPKSIFIGEEYLSQKPAHVTSKCFIDSTCNNAQMDFIKRVLKRLDSEFPGLYIKKSVNGVLFIFRKEF